MRQRHARLFWVAAGCLSISTGVVSSQGTVPQQLSRAITMFAADDAGPEAESLLKNVTKQLPVTTSDGATARYYLGRLYHRNYYMLRQASALNQALSRYREVHSKPPLGTERGGIWYADARFYKGLAYLEQGQWEDVYEAIDHIVPSLDKEIAVDYLVWKSPKRAINRRFPTDQLKSEFLAILKANKVVMNRPDRADAKTTAAVLDALQKVLEQFPRAKLAGGQDP